MFVIKKIVLGFVFIFFGLGCFSNIFAKDYSDYVSKLSTSLFQDVSNLNYLYKKNIIKNFCNKVLNFDFKEFSDNEFYYSPHQSLFILSLCTDVIDNYKNQFNGYFILSTDNSYMSGHKLDDFSPLLKGSCDPLKGDNMVKCDLYYTVSNMFNTIISDYVDIKYASIYGIQSDESEDNQLYNEDKQINDFAEKWFSLKLCDKEKSICPYPKTMKIMKDYIVQAKKTLSSVNHVNYNYIYFDSKKKINNSKENREFYCDDLRKSDSFYYYNIVMCGLYSDVDYSMKSFLNLLYNELFYYRMFVSYYSVLLQYDTYFVKTDGGKPDFNYDIVVDLNELNKNFGWSNQAISLSVKMLSEMQITFPLHVGFLLYYEKLLSFRENLAKIVTPVYTLFDKLRNVQEK